MADKIADHGRARRRLLQQQFNVIHYLGDARFLQLRGAYRRSDSNQTSKSRRNRNESSRRPSE